LAEKVPKPPAGLKRSGRALWRAVVSDYELTEHEASLLREAARTVDLLDRLEAELSGGELMTVTSQGPRVNPCAAELRQQRIAFARLLAALRVPQGEQDGLGQQRVGARGAYTLRAVE
jgi:hypothetical protein